jgi:hypothetical protein
MKPQVPLFFSLIVLFPFLLSFQGQPGPRPDRFAPSHRLPGIGADRENIADGLLDTRRDLMIQAQTFAIMREAEAVPGAERVTGPKLQALFQSAARETGFPASTLAAMSYLESFGLPAAESPSGPKGIMQISESTARSMGLSVVHATRYKLTNQTRTVRGKKRTVKTKTRYIVTLRDDRLVPERAIPAAARYLVRLEQKFNGRDWAIFAYHCGEGCVSYMKSIAEMANGFRDHSLTVARMFFNCSPAYNRNLYDAVQAQMQRDYSPTYWFRVMRAEELLALYRIDPVIFRKMADDYRSEITNAQRAPNRLSVWLRSTDLAFRTGEDIRADQGKHLVKAPENPDYFGYRLRQSGPDLYTQASPSAVGTLAYIIFEARRLYEEMKPGEPFQPVEVTSLVHPLEPQGLAGSPEAVGHSSGHVFDVELGRLPVAQRQCLQFVLDDLGWYGYLGFTEENPGSSSVHIGCSPGSRDFFSQVFQEAAAGTLAARSE